MSPEAKRKLFCVLSFGMKIFLTIIVISTKTYSEKKTKIIENQGSDFPPQPLIILYSGKELSDPIQIDFLKYHLLTNWHCWMLKLFIIFEYFIVMYVMENQICREKIIGSILLRGNFFYYSVIITLIEIAAFKHCYFDYVQIQQDVFVVENSEKTFIQHLRVLFLNFHIYVAILVVSLILITNGSFDIFIAIIRGRRLFIDLQT